MSRKKSDYLRSPCYEEPKLAPKREGREGERVRGQKWKEIPTKLQSRSWTSE